MFEINPYVPMLLSVACILATIVIAINFNEIEGEDEEKAKQEGCFENVKQGFVFIFQSKRMKALLLMIAMIWALLCVQSTYKTALLKEIGISAGMIGMIDALMEMIKGVYATKANEFNKKYANQLLTRIALCITLVMMISGCITLLDIDYRIQAMVIMVLSTVIYIFKGVYQVIKKRYMANFMKPDTLVQVYSVNSITDNLMRMLVSYIASVTLNFMNIRYAILFIGVVFTGVVLLISLYMKNRVGLKPEEYDEKDVEVVK